tara:strand:+ start:151 stop:492 length:342 start_codon:yes stop_codon:yes gene_type:complete
MSEVFGIGIDIVDINKFKNKHYEDNKKFYEKIFNDTEIKYCLKFKNSPQHFAGKFAIKEAVIKSLKKQIDFLDIKTEHENSKPIVKLNMKNEYNFFVSVSHDKDYAIAIVIIQ